jgi:hypothetical protein
MVALKKHLILNKVMIPFTRLKFRDDGRIFQGTNKNGLEQAPAEKIRH